MRAPVKKYMIDLTIAFALYGAGLFAANWLLDRFELPLWQMVLVAFLPVLPMLLVFRAALVFSRTWDELQKRIVSEAMAIAFLLVGGGTFAYGFLEDVGLPELPTSWIFPLMMVAYGLGCAVTARRYK